MHPPWDSAIAGNCRSELEVRAYGSRLLGSDADLVLYGGGNTSFKGTWSTAAGRAIPCLFVKGSGADLSQVSTDDFTPIALEPARALLDRVDLDNAALMAALEPLKLRRDAPRPSIETLLHAAIPHRYVEHTHADSILAIANTRSGRTLCAEVFGALAPVVPFHHSGFALAKACAATYGQHATPATIGLILEFHGAVAFGDDARTSYENMLRLVDRAERYLRSRSAWTLPERMPPPLSCTQALEIAGLRRQLSEAAGFPLVLCVDRSPTTMAFVSREDLAELALQGPPTPQHAVFTKRLPMIGRDVPGYVTAYQRYLASSGAATFDPAMLPDPSPRIVLDPVWGLVSASVDARHAAMALEVYLHDVAIISRAAMHDRYVSLPPAEILMAEVHYGGFERGLRARVSRDLPLLGLVVLLGAQEAAAAELAPALLEAGAAVVAVGGDPGNPSSQVPHALKCWRPLDACSPTDDELSDLIAAFGGIDVALLSPGHGSLAERLAPVLERSPMGGTPLWLETGEMRTTGHRPGARTVTSAPAAVLATLRDIVKGFPGGRAS